MQALMIIDVQRNYISNYPPALLQRINERIRQAFPRGEYVIYIINSKLHKADAAVQPLADGLYILGKSIFTKEHADAFTSPELLNFLAQQGIKEIELAGIDGNYCIAASAIGAYERGYNVKLCLNCIGARNAKRFERRLDELAAKGIKLIKNA